MSALVTLTALVVAPVACARRNPTDGADANALIASTASVGGPASSSSTESTAPSTGSSTTAVVAEGLSGPSARAPVAPPMMGAFSPSEARRVVVARIADEPLLAPHAAVIEHHFAGGPYLPLALQDVSLANGDHALLVSPTKVHAGAGSLSTFPASARAVPRDAGTNSDGGPLLLLATAERKLVWSKARPVAGVVPGVTEVAITSAPEGRVFLALYDPPTRVVAGRIWDADGSPFGDFQLMTLDACDALSALWWPGHGFVVVAARHGSARAQLLTEGGRLAWGEGAPMGAAWREAAPLSLLEDGTDGLVAVQFAHGEDGDHALAFRYDRLAKMTWARPLDLGVVPRVTDPKTRIALARAVPGIVEAKLPSARTVRIASSGHLVSP